MRSRIPALLGIEYPIIQGGMVWTSDGRLAAAVSEAGGLGLIGAGGMSPEELANQIDIARGLTGRPFGVNIPLIREDTGGLLKVLADEGVRILSASAGNPKRHTAEAREMGITVMHVVSNVKMARKAEEAGVDIIVAEGFEAGGHNGFDEIGTFPLIPQVVDAVRIPVVAAGGIADARGMVASFALGAEAVQMGTRFVASVESPAHPNFKRLIVEAGDADTVITGRAFGPVRGIRNALTDRIIQAEKEGWDTSRILEMIGPGRSRRAVEDGDPDESSFMSGQSSGLVREIRTCAEIVRELVEECGLIVSRLDCFE